MPNQGQCKTYLPCFLYPSAFLSLFYSWAALRGNDGKAMEVKCMRHLHFNLHIYLSRKMKGEPN